MNGDEQSSEDSATEEDEAGPSEDEIPWGVELPPKEDELPPKDESTNATQPDNETSAGTPVPGPSAGYCYQFPTGKEKKKKKKS